jgi:hypothetical protein
MTQYSPGPWKLTAPNEIFYIRSADGQYILKRDSKKTYDKKAFPRIEADCRLIAAAPELLAALQAIVEGDSGGTFSGSQCVEIARAAIERATA